jgi:starvation-inducible outer membrane lipoprotein
VKISLDKYFAKTSSLCIAEKIGGIKFLAMLLSRHILYAIFNTRQKMQFSQMRAGGKIVLAKNSTYNMVPECGMEQQLL